MRRLLLLALPLACSSGSPPAGPSDLPTDIAPSDPARYTVQEEEGAAYALLADELLVLVKDGVDAGAMRDAVVGGGWM